MRSRRTSVRHGLFVTMAVTAGCGGAPALEEPRPCGVSAECPAGQACVAGRCGQGLPAAGPVRLRDTAPLFTMPGGLAQLGTGSYSFPVGARVSYRSGSPAIAIVAMPSIKETGAFATAASYVVRVRPGEVRAYPVTGLAMGARDTAAGLFAVVWVGETPEKPSRVELRELTIGRVEAAFELPQLGCNDGVNSGLPFLPVIADVLDEAASAWFVASIAPAPDVVRACAGVARRTPSGWTVTAIKPAGLVVQAHLDEGRAPRVVSTDVVKGGVPECLVAGLPPAVPGGLRYLGLGAAAVRDDRAYALAVADVGGGAPRWYAVELESMAAVDYGLVQGDQLGLCHGTAGQTSVAALPVPTRRGLLLPVNVLHKPKQGPCDNQVETRLIGPAVGNAVNTVVSDACEPYVLASNLPRAFASFTGAEVTHVSLQDDSAGNVWVRFLEKSLP